MEVKTGVTRRVVLIGRWAIKFPRWYPGRAMMVGMMANLQEAATWDNYNEARRWLCPVLWCAPLGLALVMPRLQPASREARHHFLLYSVLPCDDIHVGNFGTDERGRVYLLDYGGD